MKKILFSAILFIAISCKYDSTTYRIPDYENAIRSKFFNKGWIPKTLINKQMKNIYALTDVDTNACFFKYQIPSSELEKTEQKLIKTDTIKIPSNYLKSKNKLETFLLIDKNDTVKIATDHKENIVYGWNF